jgi:hypothetical protein
MTSTAQSIVERLKQPDVSQDEVEKYLQHNAALVRVNAIEAAARLAKENERLIAMVANEAQKPQNAVRLLGTATVGHVAVGCLLRIGSPQASEAAMQLVDGWPENERDDLIWYLKSEGLLNNIA